MQISSILLVFLFGVHFGAATFNITNKLNMDNLTTTPEFTLNIENDQININIDEFDYISNVNETIENDGKNGVDFVKSDKYAVEYDIINQTDLLTAVATPTKQTQNNIINHSARTSRSFFGLFLIPC